MVGATSRLEMLLMRTPRGYTRAPSDENGLHFWICIDIAVRATCRHFRNKFSVRLVAEHVVGDSGQHKVRGLISHCRQRIPKVWKVLHTVDMIDAYGAGQNIAKLSSHRGFSIRIGHVHRGRASLRKYPSVPFRLARPFA